MNILLVSKYDIAQGGVAAVLNGLKDAMVRKGHRVYLLTHRLDTPPSTLTTQLEEHASTFHVDFGSAKWPGRLLHRKQFKQFLDNLQIDIIHSHGLSRSRLALYLSQLSEIPLVVTSHGDLNHPDVLKHKRKRLIKKVLRYADYVTHLTEPMAEKSEHIFPTRHKSQIIPNGIDLKEWGEPNPLHENYFIAMGRLVPQKGFRELIQIYSECVRSGAKESLVILGDGPEKALIVQACFEHKMRIRYELPRLRFEPNTVYLLGYIQGEAKKVLLKRGRLFVFTSRTDEALSVALLEAMAAGLPIVASDFPMTRYLQQMGMQAKLCPPNSIKLFSEMILTMLKENTDALGKANHDAVKNFSLPKIHDSYENLYSEIAHKHTENA